MRKESQRFSLGIEILILPIGRITKNIHVNSVCIGCMGHHVTLSLGCRHCDRHNDAKFQNILRQSHHVW